jgi:hypothetical protein
MRLRCLRLQELFEDLEAVPGESMVVFSDTQKINYLLSAIRHERSLTSVYTMIQSDQLRGRITFDQACEDLRYRCEAIRADELLNTAVRTTKIRALAATTSDDATGHDDLPLGPLAGAVPALITSANKRQNAAGAKKGEKNLVECLAKGCATLTPKHLRLCRMHYHECIAGKHPSLPLKTGDSATYDQATNKIVFPHLAGTTAPSKKSVRALVASN